MMFVCVKDYEKVSQLPLKDENEDVIPGSNNPLLISKAVVNSFKIAYAILTDQETHKPSSLAGISAEELQFCSTIKMIDRLFIKAHNDYTKQFVKAIHQDYEVFKKKRDASAEIGKSMLTGGVRAAQLVNVPVLKLFTAPFLFLGGLFYGLIRTKCLTKERILLESSQKRCEWADLLTIQELQRIEAATDLVNLRIETLEKNIADLGNLKNVNYDNELLVLNKFKEYLVGPKIELIDDYLDTMQPGSTQPKEQTDDTIIELDVKQQ